jgi:hypothetical protein
MADTPRQPNTFSTDISTQLIYVWSGLDGDDTGIPIKMARYSDKTVHFYSDAWGGSTVTLEGSNDSRADPSSTSYASSKWFNLTDGTGTSISLTADGGRLVSENPLWVRPKTSGGTSASITVALNGNKAP